MMLLHDKGQGLPLINEFTSCGISTDFLPEMITTVICKLCGKNFAVSHDRLNKVGTSALLAIDFEGIEEERHKFPKY